MAKVTGLEGVVAGETDIGLVDGEKGYLVYRGYWAKELAVTRTYEEVAYLLWNGHLPSAEELERLKSEMAASRQLPGYIRQIIELMPASVPMMLVLQSTVAALGEQENTSWPPVVAQAVRLASILPTIIAYRYRTLNGLTPLEPLSELGHAANYLYMLTGEKPTEAHVQALSAYLILCMEHGMNASTFAARVVLSTESDMNAAVAGAIGAMKGPLHGGAPYEVIAMLEDIGTEERAEPWLRKALESGTKIMGFGHRIYKTKDPRAEALQIATQEMIGKDPSFDLALHVEATAIHLLQEYKPGRRLFTNVEFYAAAILKALELSPDIFTPTFTAGRIIGWTAHIMEQAANNRIFRPQSVYTGPMPQNEF